MGSWLKNNRKNVNEWTFVKKKVFEKRFYTRGTVRCIRIWRLAKIPTPYHDWLTSFNKEKGQSSELDRRERGFARLSL